MLNFQTYMYCFIDSIDMQLLLYWLICKLLIILMVLLQHNDNYLFPYDYYYMTFTLSWLMSNEWSWTDRKFTFENHAAKSGVSLNKWRPILRSWSDKHSGHHWAPRVKYSFIGRHVMDDERLFWRRQDEVREARRGSCVCLLGTQLADGRCGTYARLCL